MHKMENKKFLKENMDVQQAKARDNLAKVISKLQGSGSTSKP